MDVKDHVSLPELERLSRLEKDAKKAQRIQAVLLAINGYAAEDIARSLGPSRRTCQRWIRRYNEEGFVGLSDKPGRGKPPLLTPDQQSRLKQRIDAGPTEADGVCTLRGKDIQRILESEFGKVRSLDTVYYLLHQMGYSSLTPRPQHRNADIKAQEDFKKSSRRSSKRSLPSSRANA